MSDNSASRLPALDGLRAISILLVMASHMLWVGPKVLELNFTSGAMGMSLFFSLSGFLIVSALIHNPDVSEFLIRRLTRIVPLAYTYAIIVFTLVHYDPPAILWTFSFLGNYFPDHLVQGYTSHFWSLCVEMHFYLAIAIVVMIVGQKGVWIVWPACVLVTVLRIASGASYPYETHLRIDEILVGGCVATLFQPAWRGALRYPGTCTAIAALAWFLCSHPASGPLQYFRPYATAAVLSTVLCHGDTIVMRFLASRPMQYIATISYALYVVHLATIQGWWNEGSVLERFLLKRPISFAMSFAIAHLSTFYWESFWLKLGRQWIARRRVPLLTPSPPA